MEEYAKVMKQLSISRRNFTLYNFPCKDELFFFPQQFLNKRVDLGRTCMELIQSLLRMKHGTKICKPFLVILLNLFILEKKNKCRNII